MLNHAAAVPVLDTRARALRVFVVALFVSLFAATAASALDGINLSEPAEPTAEGECPRLVQIKYPFLSCANGEIGQSDENEIWFNSRRIPVGSGFVEGDGYYGEDLNPL